MGGEEPAAVVTRRPADDGCEGKEAGEKESARAREKGQ